MKARKYAVALAPDNRTNVGDELYGILIQGAFTEYLSHAKRDARSVKRILRAQCFVVDQDTIVVWKA